VIQGGVLSPNLFIIMFNDLVDRLSNLGFDVFAYADDLAVIAEGSDKLDELIEIVESWTRENLMKINKKKSGLMMLHSKRGRNKKLGEFYEDYPIKKEYKYLGIIIDNRLNFISHLNYVTAIFNITSGMGSIIHLGYRLLCGKFFFRLSITSPGNLFYL
jgi:hypothetical protein